MNVLHSANTGILPVFHYIRDSYLRKMEMKQDKIKKQVDSRNEQLKGKSPQDVLRFFVDVFRGKIIQSSSMGAEDQVITDMLMKIDKNIPVFTLDTGRMFQETYNLIADTNKKYGIRISLYFPEKEAVEKMVREKGPNLMYESVENRKLCCRLRKTEPVKRALKDKDAWISGIRKDQSVTRFFNKICEWDETFGALKINPLLEWTEKQVWDYIRENNVPYNVLHDQGYPSIGCAPCTRAVQPGEPPRAGRWWWEEETKKECGLHNADK